MNFKKIICGSCLLASLCALILPFGAAAEDISENKVSGVECTEALSENVKIDSRIFELFSDGAKRSSESITLVPGGTVFGIKMKQEYVSITDASGFPALSVGDIIISVNGNDVHTVEDVRKIVENSGGKSVTIKAIHKGSEITIEAKPQEDNGSYKLGLGLKDGASGIGTITFYDPKSGVFGGLGHGICDSETGDVIAMENGQVCGVVLGGIHKGECGKPGELSGILKNEVLGTLEYNNECGVFGHLTDTHIIPSGNAVAVGTRDDVHEGEAKIISTLKTGKTAEYTIKIYDIDKSSTGSKSFRIKTSDPALLAISGGIVRGMSGSPIIQDGKLIGAVTHVMVADPTEGYGIFIENMLNSANIQGIQKAA